MATNSAPKVETAGHQTASSDESEREEPGFPQDYSTMDVSPRTQRPPMPLPVGEKQMAGGERHLGRSGRSNTASRSSAGGTYQRVPDSDPDTHHNRAYGAADGHRAGIQRENGSGSRRGRSSDETGPLLNQPDKLFGMNMKKYILSSLGMLNIPGTSVSCTWIAVLFYFFLAAWGVGILTTATQTIFTSLTEEDCRKMIPSFVLAMLGGTFFIFLGLYWVLVFWWTKVSDNTPKKVSFSFLTILWFILATLFIGTAAALATEVYEHSDIIANFTGDVPCDSADSMEDSKLPYHFNLIPMLALGSMVIFWLVYVCVFLVHCMLF